MDRTRQLITRTAVAFSVGVLSCACSSDDSGVAPDGPTSRDAGVNDQRLVDQTSDQFRGDLGLGEGFGLMIPDNTQACTQFAGSLDGVDVLAEYPVQGRVSFKSQLIRLPREKSSFEIDWIAKLELGPNGAEAGSSGPATVNRTLEGNASDGRYRYVIEQPFDHDNQTYVLSYETAFEVAGGVAATPLVTLDEALLSSPLRWQMSGDFTSGPRVESRRKYGTCRFEHMFLRIAHEVKLENGLAISMQERLDGGAAGLCKVCPATILSAKISHGGDAQTIDNFFQLAYAAGHHNWNAQYLIIFNTPIDGAHALRLAAGSALKIDKATLLDATLEPLTEVIVTEHNKANR